MLLSSLLKKIRQQLALILAVSLVLLAAYVSIGRQFMPAVSGYVTFFEEKMSELSGVPVGVQSLMGDFEGFNPILHVNGMSVLIANEQSHSPESHDAALFLRRASVSIDVPQSIWQRTWVLEDFVVESLELNLDQSESGKWHVRGLNSASDNEVDLNNLYRSLQRVSQLSLRNVVINLRTFDGEVLSFRDGLATIQNRGGNHYLHADFTLAGSAEQISFSFEVTGNKISDIEGQLHLDLPEADYSELFQRQKFAQMSVQQLFGGGDFWFGFSQGQLRSFISTLNIGNVTFVNADSEPLSLRDLSGKVRLGQVDDPHGWQLALSDMSLSWQQLNWSSFNAFIDLRSGQSVDIKADNIDISLIARFFENSGLLDNNAQQQLEMYAPRGQLENFNLFLPLAESPKQHLSLRTNLTEVDIATVRGSPNIWGIKGYAEIDYDMAMRQASGFAEIESEEFRINIPSTFTRTWDHNYVNGRLGFSLDLNQGMNLRLASNVIVAESDIIDGRVKFTSIINRPNEGEPKAELELLVGALRLDTAGRASYLPDGPNIKNALANTIQWLDGGIIDGTVSGSGVLYRGSTLPNAPAVSKTFQGFYFLDDSEINFSDEWPNLNDVIAYVTSDDNNVDIEVQTTNSLGLNADTVIGSIRKNAKGENWLSISGVASGPTANGLNYLQNAAVGEGLKNALASWQAQGNFSANIAVEVPLNSPQSDTEVRLEMSLENNNLYIPEYALGVSELTGPIVFDTRAGIEQTELPGRLFEQQANIQLSSELVDGELNTILVQATGLVEPDQLIAWPLQGQFVRNILANMEGQFAYQAILKVDQSDTSEPVNHLNIDSTLLGASLSLPYPFAKPAEVELPLSINMEFSDSRQQVVGTLGPNLSFDLALEQGSIRDGLVLVGDSQSDFENLRDNNSEGLAVLGSIDRFQLEQWSDFLAEFTSEGAVSEGVGGSIDFVDIQIDSFELYGEQLSAVNMRVVPELADQVWNIGLESESVAGLLKLPFDRDDYLDLNLRYLRLPGDETDRIDPSQEISIEQTSEEEELVDVLADIDPRELPRMHFSTDEFYIGDLPYGSWSFTLNPNSSGVEVDNLAFDFRGLRLGMDKAADGELEEQSVSHFSWHYDGIEHGSALAGVLTADDMADVLTANGYAASLESDSAEFVVDISWPGSPAFFAASGLSGDIGIDVEDGRFLQGAGGAGALKLISILNFDAIMRRLRFSDDLHRKGLAYDDIEGQLKLSNGLVNIEEQLVISGPSSLYQITGDLDLKEETISGEMYLTLPVSENIPWLGLLTANIPLAVGAYLFDRVFGSQVNSLTSAVYTLEGPWEGLEPEFKQAFGSPNNNSNTSQPDAVVQ